jgi:hypothetical protein
VPRPEERDLRSLQAAFLEDLTGHRPRTEAERAALFAEPPQGDVERRWGIYTFGYLARLAEAIENDYPATRRILGEGAFRSLAARYLERHLPGSFDIGRAGDRLAAFLETDPLAADLPFLPDLARFEWSLADAFVAADSEPLAWSDLARLGPEAVADTVFRPRPGTAVIRSRWPLLDLSATQDLADQDVSIALEGHPSVVLVYRQDLEVRRRLVGELDARFLETAGRGIRLAEILDEAASSADADRLVERFRLWVMEGVFEKPGTPPQAAVPFEKEER